MTDSTTESGPTTTPPPTRKLYSRRFQGGKAKPEPKPRKPRVSKPIHIYQIADSGDRIVNGCGDGSLFYTELEARKWLKAKATDGQTYRIMRELSTVTVRTATVTKVTLE